MNNILLIYFENLVSIFTVTIFFDFCLLGKMVVETKKNFFLQQIFFLVRILSHDFRAF